MLTGPCAFATRGAATVAAATAAPLRKVRRELLAPAGLLVLLISFLQTRAACAGARPILNVVPCRGCKKRHEINLASRNRPAADLRRGAPGLCGEMVRTLGTTSWSRVP